MKNRILILLISISYVCLAQQKQYTADVNYFYGSILPHSQKIQHLITDHPEGVFVAVNQKTFGEKEWESRFSYPDFGVSFHFQNNKNKSLGDMYGLFLHYNFYFLKRNLMLRIGQGVAYNTNPYDKEENYRNVAYSTHLMPSSYFMLNYKKENIIDGFGIQAGAFLIHHSNGTMKSPNTSTNTVGANVGINYVLDSKNERELILRMKDSTYTEPIKFNLALRSGVQESRVIGTGQYPFYFISAYADKRFTKSSAVQAGVDVFISPMYKNEIKYMSIAFPELNINPDLNSTRIGLFAGYELFINRLSFEGQLGFYVLDEYEANTALYQRLGLKYYFWKEFFAGTSLKTHFSKAEAMEFSVGVRL
ncbi:acyloxyacyl hydrolase [Moheibacter sediminis]|uniref:Lipid A 3-O-deacylase (PagL) n=1 Tax=Moheibacter sediminis TaxID=1434700 RepID=A0A1W1Y670_9FLAO|nr:acyloxyacyl hydrolase [Moheibacter sediminis]SMC31643.1 Lipid A 3-O-deacylase (PagL) [Moheibacter sediminis]